MDRNTEYLKVPQAAEVLRIARSRDYELVADGFPCMLYFLIKLERLGHIVFGTLNHMYSQVLKECRTEEEPKGRHTCQRPEGHLTGETILLRLVREARESYMDPRGLQQFRMAEKNECDRLESIVDDMEHPGEVYSYEPLCRY